MIAFWSALLESEKEEGEEADRLESVADMEGVESSSHSELTGSAVSKDSVGRLENKNPPENAPEKVSLEVVAKHPDISTSADISVSPDVMTPTFGNAAIETTPTDLGEDQSSKLLSRDELVALFREISPVPAGSLNTVGMVSCHSNCYAVSALSIMYSGGLSKCGEELHHQCPISREESAGLSHSREDQALPGSNEA